MTEHKQKQINILKAQAYDEIKELIEEDSYDERTKIETIAILVKYQKQIDMLEAI